MLIVSQNKEKVMQFGICFNALEYTENIDRKGKKEIARHTICISDGCLEEVAEYPTKERCLEVLKSFCEMYENECYTTEFFDIAAQANRTGLNMKNSVFRFPEE